MEVLLFAVGTQRCALPLADVAEVMRAQPLTSHARLTPGVLGTAVIRGRATPVIDAGQLLTGAPTLGERIVLLRVGNRAVALAVDSVLGTTELNQAHLSETPALLNGEQTVLKAIGVLDSELINVLDAVRLVRESHVDQANVEVHQENGAAEA